MPQKNPLKNIKANRVFIPVVIGLSVVVYMFLKEFDVKVFKTLDFTIQTAFWLFIAILLMLCRDVGYVIRLMLLSDNRISLKRAIRVVFLWEFTSAITPSAVGGTSVAVLYVHKENIPVGQASAIVMATSFLDELYFLITFPVLFLISGSSLFLDLDGGSALNFSNKFFLFALIGYTLKLVYTLVLSYGLFINPKGLKWLLYWVFRLPVLKKWRYAAMSAGTEIMVSSRELKRKKPAFWLKTFGATAFSWTSRYWVVNALFLAFFAVPDHFLLFSRQLVSWIIMLVSPTPGGSGISELVFVHFLGDFVAVSAEFKSSMEALLALLWRLISYYPYLIIGVIIFPKWIRNKFIKIKD